MTCNCLSEICTKVVEHNNANNPRFAKNKILNASFKDVVFNLDKGQMLLKTHMVLLCEGRKNPLREPVVLTYCPFCGKKYSDEG